MRGRIEAAIATSVKGTLCTRSMIRATTKEILSAARVNMSSRYVVSMEFRSLVSADIYAELPSCSKELIPFLSIYLKATFRYELAA